MIIESKPLVEINQQALLLLYRELGVVNAVRFLRQFTTGFGDYTEERDALFGRKTLQEIVGEIEERKGSLSNAG
ncbi:MAG: hypothetical protein JXA78_13835 [Anaerolineales bacterium]|nr:hypothetical protein [Anaerolineales bacterium]